MFSVTTPDRADLRQTAREDVAAEIDQACNPGGGREAEELWPFFTSLVATPERFNHALPKLLTCLAKASEEIQRLVARALAMRPHWISASNVDDLFVPAVVSGISSLKDRSVADQLIAAVCLIAPRLGEKSITALTERLSSDGRGESEEDRFRVIALGLLGPRILDTSADLVGRRIQSVLSEYREALNTVDTPEAPSGEDSCLLLRLTLVSLFAQRNLGTGLYPGKDLHNCRSALLAECRQSFQAIATAIKGGYLPEREEYHQMLITTFPVDPIISYEKLVALSQMSVELASDNPDLALVLSRILLQNRAKKDLFETLRELARKQPAESVPFASAVMRAAVNVECSMNNALSQRDATVSYSEITELLKRIKDPYLAYYVLELQRVLAERFPELQQSES